MAMLRCENFGLIPFAINFPDERIKYKETLEANLGLRVESFVNLALHANRPGMESSAMPGAA